MGTRIQRLEDTLVDQIAAGEVVERPASIAKELIENALDAGAKRVRITTEQGGVSRLSVQDDGVGIPEDQVELALTRHATSKIRELGDLSSIQTLGFRGEALPSIASVSRFSLTTRTSDSDEAVRVLVDGGGTPKVRRTAGPVGTHVDVRDLFFNVPARRKFLKSQSAESGRISAVVVRTALADPSLHLSLTRASGRTREFLPQPSLLDRVTEVFGGAPLVELNFESLGAQVTTILGPPERARSGTQGLHLFINGRPIHDRALARAVAFAYGSVLPPGRYPIGTVHLKMDPALVDVNVHPRKEEARFAGGRALMTEITRGLSKALSATHWQGIGAVAPRPGSERPKNQAAGSPFPSDTSPQPDRWGLMAALRRTEPIAETVDSVRPLADQTGAPWLTEGPLGSLRVLGQANRMFLICEGKSELVVIDQHAADERLRYERLKRTYADKVVTPQRLLFPERVELSEVEAELVEQHLSQLRAVGLECRLLGQRTVAIHSVPELVKRADPKRLLQDFLDEASRQGDRNFGDAIDMALATMACHGALRGGDEIHVQEAAALIRDLNALGAFSGHCPHGRPVVVKLPFSSLATQLGR